MRDWIAKAKEEYENACSFSQKSPESPFEPYRDKYKAKELFEQLLIIVSNAECSEEKDLLSALFHYEIGVICLDTEESAAGEQHLTTALSFLEEYMGISKYRYALLPLNIYNQLGILWSTRKELEKSMDYLKKAENLYIEVSSGHQDVLTFLQFFSLDDEVTETSDPDGESEVNKAHAHTLYYLAQVYSYQEDAEQAAMYCFKTLKWQIDHKLSFDPLEWSLNSAILSQYFATKEQFNVARHLLSCSSLNLSESTEKEESDGDDSQKHTKGDVQRCWGKYGLSLLTSSKQRLTEGKGDASNESGSYKNPFALLDCDLSRWEGQVTDRHVQSYEDAREVFLHAHKCFNDAKTYYTINEYASDYIGIVQDISKLYNCLAFFEPSYERACKMFKRRADILEETLNSLNAKYYLNTCRQLQFELADIYSEMMDMKISLKEKNMDARSAQKINTLIEKSIHHFSTFISTLEENKVLLGRFPEDLVRPALLAHFYLGRLYSKIISSQPEKQLENLQLSDKYYSYVADYIKKNTDHEHYIAEELEVITEMLKLLPQRVQMIAKP